MLQKTTCGSGAVLPGQVMDGKELQGTRVKLKDGLYVSCTTYNALGMVHRAGEIFAVAHPVVKTGFKINDGKRRLDTKSNYQQSYGTAGGGMFCKRPQKYHPNAPRNRLPPMTETRRACRYGARPQSASTSCVINNAPDYAGRFVTVQQRSYTRKGMYPTGYANQGIVAAATKWHHQRIKD